MLQVCANHTVWTTPMYMPQKEADTTLEKKSVMSFELNSRGSPNYHASLKVYFVEGLMLNTCVGKLLATITERTSESESTHCRKSEKVTSFVVSSPSKFLTNTYCVYYNVFFVFLAKAKK